MKRLANDRPIVLLAIVMSLSIVSAYFMYFDKMALAFTVIGIMLFCVIFSFYIARKNKSIKKCVITISIFLAVSLFAFISFFITVKNYDDYTKENHYYKITGRVSNLNEQESYINIILDDLQLQGVNGEKSGYKAVVCVFGDAELELGDIICFYGYFTERSSTFEDRFSASNINDKIKFSAQVNVSDITKLSNEANIFDKINISLKKALQNGLDDDEFSVSFALLTGDSSFIDDDLLTSFRYAGVSHIFAVSGLHIGFLATFFSLIFAKIPIKKYYKAIIISIILFFYSGICGFSASSLRATIMFSVLLFARAFGYKYDTLSSISLAQVIILLISPIQLFTAGFVLSFGVVYGIILLNSPLSKCFKFLPKKLANSISSVIIAQAISIPLCLLFFNQFSLFSLIANIVFLPVVAVIFIALLLSVIISIIFSFSGILLPISYVMKVVNYSVSLIDYKPFIISSLSLGIFSIFYYLALLISSGVINLKRLYKMIAILSLVVVFITGGIVTTINENNSIKVYISGSDTASYVYLEKDDKNLLVITDINYVFSTYSFNRLVKNTNKTKIDRIVLLSNGQSKDLQVISTKLMTVFDDIKQICYYGEENQDMEKVMEKIFPKIACLNIKEEESYKTEMGQIEYKKQGYALKIMIEEYNFLLFGKFGNKEADYKNIDGDFELVTAYDYMEGIEATYKPKTFVSYRYTNDYLSGENQGLTELIFN